MYKSLHEARLTDYQREQLNFLLLQANRYEKVRKMNPVQFADLYHENIATGVYFDVLVDDLDL